MRRKAPDNSPNATTAGPATLPVLWTKETLAKEDYEFAISKSPNKWECMATKLRKHRHLAIAMYEWELWREVADSKISVAGRWSARGIPRPFLAVEENRHRVETALKNPGALKTKPADLAPLEELPIQKAAERESFRASASNDSQFRKRLALQMFSIHAFCIWRDEPTDQVVQRFRNWLVKYRTMHEKPALMKYGEETDMRLKQGNLHIDRLLMALAVYRLKQAGYKRKEAEEMLNLKAYSLTPYLLARSSSSDATQKTSDHWSKMPRLVESEIARLLATQGRAFNGKPPFPFVMQKKLP